MKIWLHKSLKKSQLVEKDSDEYEKLLKRGWKLHRIDTLKKEPKKITPLKKTKRRTKK